MGPPQLTSVEQREMAGTEGHLVEQQFPDILERPLFLCEGGEAAALTDWPLEALTFILPSWPMPYGSPSISSSLLFEPVCRETPYYIEVC